MIYNNYIIYENIREKNMKKDTNLKMKRTNQKNKKKRNSGITIIAMVATIVVLIILAAISLQTTFGDNGIIENVNQAQYLNKKAKAKEALQKFVNAKILETGNTKYLPGNLIQDLGNSPVFANKFRVSYANIEDPVIIFDGESEDIQIPVSEVIDATLDDDWDKHIPTLPLGNDDRYTIFKVSNVENRPLTVRFDMKDGTELSLRDLEIYAANSQKEAPEIREDHGGVVVRFKRSNTAIIRIYFKKFQRDKTIKMGVNNSNENSKKLRIEIQKFGTHTQNINTEINDYNSIHIADSLHRIAWYDYIGVDFAEGEAKSISITKNIFEKHKNEEELPYLFKKIGYRLKEIPNGILEGVQARNFKYFFANLDNVVIPEDIFRNIPEMTNIDYMFSGAKNLTVPRNLIKIGGFQDARGTFEYTDGLRFSMPVFKAKTIPQYGNYNTDFLEGGLFGMSYMFKGAKNMTIPDNFFKGIYPKEYIYLYHRHSMGTIGIFEESENLDIGKEIFNGVNSNENSSLFYKAKNLRIDGRIFDNMFYESAGSSSVFMRLDDLFKEAENIKVIGDVYFQDEVYIGGLNLFYGIKGPNYPDAKQFYTIGLKSLFSFTDAFGDSPDIDETYINDFIDYISREILIWVTQDYDGAVAKIETLKIEMKKQARGIKPNRMLEISNDLEKNHLLMPH